MQPGDLVKVRAHGGQELVRRVVAVMEQTVSICRDEEYRAAKKEGRHPVAVGFRRDDVLGKAS